MSSRKIMTGRAQVMNVAPEPKGSPLRVECRGCGAKPGQKCRSFANGEIEYIHDARRRDHDIIQADEAKLAGWNRTYGK